MRLRRASSMVAVLAIAVVLVSSIALTWTEPDGAAAFAPAAPAGLSPTPAITPVSPIPALPSPSPSADGVTNTGKHLVIGVVLGIMAIVVAGFVVLWFVVD